MKLLTLLAIIVGCAAVIACIVRYYRVHNYEADRYTHALSTLQKDDTSILICLYNKNQNGYAIKQFIEHACDIAYSPLRLAFAVCEDSTIHRSLHTLIDSIQTPHRVDVRVRSVPTPGIQHCFEYWKEMHGREKIVLVCDPVRMDVYKAFDQVLTKLLMNDVIHPGCIYSSVSPESFCGIEPNDSNILTIRTHTYLFDSAVAVPSLLAHPTCMLMYSRTLRQLGPSTAGTTTIDSPTGLQHDIGAILQLVEYLLGYRIQLRTAPFQFFFSRPAVQSLLPLVHNHRQENKHAGADNQQLTLRKQTRAYIGLSKEGTVEARTILGLTADALKPTKSIVEARTKFGSLSQARARLNQAIQTLTRRFISAQ